MYRRKHNLSVKGERGSALILAIAFLGILSIIGAVVIRYAGEGMKSAGKMLPEKQVFNVADSAIEFSLNREIIVTLAGMSPGTATLMLQDPNNTIGTPATPWRNLLNTSNAGIIEGQVTDLGPGDLPAGAAGLYSSDFAANFYQVQVKVGNPPPPSYTNTDPYLPPTGYLNDVAAGKVKTTHINASIMRLYKLDDDTIFRTSGGG